MKLTPIQSIKRYCKVSCCCEDMISWKECSVKNCPLYPYRLGKRPRNIEQDSNFEATNGIREQTYDNGGIKL